MRIGRLVAAGILVITAADASAGEAGVGRMTANLEATAASEGDTSLCMLNFKAFDNNSTTDGQMVVETKFGMILDEEEKAMLHYLSVRAMDVKSVEPVALTPVMPLSAHLEVRAGVSTAEDRRAQVPEDDALATFFSGEGSALQLHVEMLKDKEIIVVMKRPNGRDIKIPVALTEPVDGGSSTKALTEYNKCQIGLWRRLETVRAAK